VIQIVFRHKIAAGTEAAFVAAWESCKARMLGRVHGFLEASLFRNESDATEVVSMTRWASLDDWKNYWGKGIPDPEGELPRNEVLVELRTLAAPVDREPARRSLMK